jgi:hypothetical protein
MKSWQVSESEIRNCVDGLKSDLQRERELSLERLTLSLVVALHFPPLFKKAKWK